MGGEALRARLSAPRAFVLGLSRVLGVDATGRLIVQLLAFLVARELGPENFGAYMLGVTVLSTLGIIIDFGTSDASVQRYTGIPQGHVAFRNAVAGSRMAAAIIVSSIAAVAAALTSGEETLFVSFVLLVGLLPQVVAANSALEQRILVNLTNSSLILAGAATLSAAGATVGAVLFGSAGAAALGFTATALLLGIFMTVRGLSVAPHFSLTQFRELIVWGSPFFITAISVNLYTRGDRFFVAAFAGTGTLGYYSAAYTLVFGFAMLGAALQIVSFPPLRRRFQQTGRLDGWQRHAAMAFGIGILLSILIGGTSAFLLTHIFGPAFGSASQYLQILSFLIPFYTVNPLLANILVVTDHQRVLATIAVTNLVLALTGYWLCGITAGAKGIAITSVLVELFGMIQMLYTVRKVGLRSR